MTIMKTTLKVAAGVAVCAAVGVAAYTVYDMLTDDDNSSTGVESESSAEVLGDIAATVKEQIDDFLLG